MALESAERTRHLTPSATLAIDARAKTMKAEGLDVVGFGAGEPDFDTPEHIKAAAMGALDAGFTKYTPSSGIPELRSAIAEKLKADNGLSYEPSQINPGDEVLIPAPYWLSYPEMVRVAGGEPVIVPTSAENGYKLTPELFREYMSPLTKMVILNTPGNPTGTVYSENELAALAEVALDEEIYILSDEIYEKLTYDDAKHSSLASFSKEVYNLTFTVNGFSKPYAMTGWRLGYVAAPAHLAKVIDSIQSHTTSHPTSFAQKGALAAYKGPQDCVAEMRKDYDKRRRRFCDLLALIPKLSFVKPTGAFYILANVSKTGLTSTEFAEKLLEKERVAVVPGKAFGDDHTVRLSYATSIEQIEEGARRLAKFCK
jgi:aspartate aminotransferase